MPMYVKSQKNWNLIYGLIDSGSESTLFPMDFAVKNNIGMKDAKPVKNMRGLFEGRGFGYQKKISVKIVGEEGVSNRFLLPIIFVSRPIIDEFILGRDVIMEKFKVIFDPKAKRTIFEEI